MKSDVQQLLLIVVLALPAGIDEMSLVDHAPGTIGKDSHCHAYFLAGIARSNFPSLRDAVLVV